MLALVGAQKASAQRSSVQQKGDRFLAIAINESPGLDFSKAFRMSKSAGIQTVELALPWDEVERAPGKYRNIFPGIANSFYPANGVRVALELNPIDTNNLRMPADLRGKSFDDPDVMKRYKATLKWVFEQMPNTSFSSLAIGNEIDATLLNQKDKWERYSRFFAEAASYARELRPGLFVGAKATASGLLGDARQYARNLNARTDIVMVTYYPLKPDFTVSEPASLEEMIAGLTNIYPLKQIYFMELGYPSASENNSSETKQAAFVKHAFQVWDRHSSHVRFINFVWLCDRSSSEIKHYEKYYRLSDKKFLSYLASLGLCRADGSVKPAFQTLVTEAKSRGW